MRIKPAASRFLLLLVLAWNAQAAPTFFEPVQPARRFQVMARPGAITQQSEDSRSALIRLVEEQFEWVELAVHSTPDGLHVVFGETNAAPAFAGERPLSLRECLALCKGKINLKLNCGAAKLEQVAQEILDETMERQIVLSVDTDSAHRLGRRFEGRIATIIKWTPVALGAVWTPMPGLAAVEIDAPQFGPAFCADRHSEGLKVLVRAMNEPDRPQVWDRVIAAGADWVLTDVPEELLANAVWRRCPRRPVQISCHRGANRYAPENTLPAFQKAVSLGVDYVEFDVRGSKDGQYFLLHDSKLDRTTDGLGPIGEMSASSVTRLSAGIRFGPHFADARVPTLDEFLHSFGGKVGLYVDAKAIPAPSLADRLAHYGVLDRAVVYQSPDFLAELRKINPRVRLLPPLSNARDFESIAKLKPYAVDVDWDILSKELVAQCHARNIKVFSDALGGHERIDDYLQAIDWGVDVIQTDYPLRVLRAIELWLDKNGSQQ